MKILVVSDSHGDKRSLVRAARDTGPELILHLGDYDKDCASLHDAVPNIPVRAVRGNGDWQSHELGEDEFVIAGVRIFMTHGHWYGVKRGLDTVIDAAFCRNADILLFGHTHIPYYAKLRGITILNPGSIGMGGKTYAVLTIENGIVSHEFASVDGKN